MTAGHCWCWWNIEAVCCWCEDDSEGENLNEICPRAQTSCKGRMVPTDLVELLRYSAQNGVLAAGTAYTHLLTKAAAEIERLQTQIEHPQTKPETPA